jgi:murein DD-endopeptidase MepM/ murein hydrolase activator NlpD
VAKKKPPNIDSKSKSIPSKGNYTTNGDNIPINLGPVDDNPINQNEKQALTNEDLEPVDILNTTPNAQGVTPLAEQEAASARASEIINSDSSSEDTFTLGGSPHFFSENDYQVYYHDVIVYIQGADVSDWLEGAISIKYGTNKDPNTCDFTLNNAGNRFVLTPENLAGKWRTSTNSVNNDYDESAKETIFRFKSDPAKNPPDPASNGLVWPLSHWSTIFHKYDPIRVWIRNPAARLVDGALADEWLPVFTGYITNFPTKENHINAGSTLQIHAEDIRTIMQNMRVNTNSYLYIKQGNEAQFPSTSKLPEQKQPNTLRFGPNSNVHMKNTFFKDLLLSANTDDPWAQLSFKEVVESLTFANDAYVVINRSQNVKRSIDQNNSYTKRIRDTEKLQGTPLSAEEKEDIQQQVLFDEKSKNLSGDPPKTENSSSPANGSSSTQSRLGRMQRGLFHNQGYPSDREKQIQFLEQWYSLCAFGSPIRDNKDYLKFNLGDLRYWTSTEVKQAGINTQTFAPWAPDAQAVHLIEPGLNTSALPVFKEYKMIENDNISAVTRDFTNRLELLDKACSIVDYRFWVTGTGDLVFEFPQYDFNPKDYGRWENVLTFDRHIISEDLDEEASDIPTVMVGTNSTLPISGIDPNQGERAQVSNANRVVVWSPVLTVRLGVNVHYENYPRVTDKDRLLTLTHMAFQKKLGTFTRYKMETNYRPWVQPNRPIYNKYKSRYALTESVSFNLPVTAGNKAGYISPTSNMNLNYIRSIDALGVPRYVTGGPSMPIFFGLKQDNALISSLSRSLGDLDSSLEQLKLNSNSLSVANLKTAFDQFGSFLPTGHDRFNIIDVIVSEPVANEIAAIAPNAIEELNSTAVALRKTITDLQDGTIVTRTAFETKRLIEEAQDQLKELDKLFKKANLSYSNTVTALSGKPYEGGSGIRSADWVPPNEAAYNESTERSPENTCKLDHYTFSSPLGKAASNLTFQGAVIQQVDEFPRMIITDFRVGSTLLSEVKGFEGVDFLAMIGENVYATADGVVTDIVTSDEYGKVVTIAHDNGYVTSYAPVSASVSVGQKIIRNHVIGTVTNSRRSDKIGEPVLHFQTGTGLTDNIVSFIVGSRRTYPLTEEDVTWITRAVVGEAGPEVSFDTTAVVSAMINRYAFINDTSLAVKGVPVFSSFTHMLVGLPPNGGGYSTPVSYKARSPGARTIDNQPINTDPDKLAKRKFIRELGTSAGAPIPSAVSALVRDLCTGKVTLLTRGIVHFAEKKTAESYIAKNALKDGSQQEYPEASNVFISNRASRAWNSQGVPKIQTTPPVDYRFHYYPPTNSGQGFNPGVPHKVYIPAVPFNDNVGSWERNKVLIVGSLSKMGLGPELKLLLEAEKANVFTFSHVFGTPGNTGSIRDLTSAAKFNEYKQALTNIKPDVVIFMYSASEVSNENLNKGLRQIKEATLAVGAEIWWIGPPVYSPTIPQFTYRPVFEAEGTKVFGSRYVRSESYTDPLIGRSANLLYVMDGAKKWAAGIMTVITGKNLDPTNDAIPSNKFQNGWGGAIAPEDCPPVKQR